MFPEYDIIFHVHDIHDIIWVVVFQKHENIEFNTCLVHVFLFILDDFDCNFVLQFVVEALNSLSERTLSQEWQDFPPVSDVVPNYYFVVAFIIIVIVVVQLLSRAFDLLRFIRAERVNHIKLKTLSLFILI